MYYDLHVLWHRRRLPLLLYQHLHLKSIELVQLYWWFQETLITIYVYVQVILLGVFDLNTIWIMITLSGFAHEISSCILAHSITIRFFRHGSAVISITASYFALVFRYSPLYSSFFDYLAITVIF